MEADKAVINDAEAVGSPSGVPLSPEKCTPTKVALISPKLSPSPTKFNGDIGESDSPMHNCIHDPSKPSSSSSPQTLDEDESKRSDIKEKEETNPGDSNGVRVEVSQKIVSSEADVKSKPACEEKLSPIVSPVSSRSPAADLIHQVKWINWHGTKTPIVTQNENGPCPLLAAMNVLLLRGQVNFPDELEVVTSQSLMERLGDCILRLTPTEFAHRPDYQQNISDAIAVLPKLMTGLDVNVKFTGVSEFEYTPECIVFDLLNIPLYHGWLVEPENLDVARVINSSSYNQLVEKIIDFKSSGDSVKVSEALLAEQFLETSASQLTYHGLYELNNRMKDNELAVFFRNNHFSTLVKNQTGLFLLVTDQGFLNEKAFVWETLNNIEGDSKFLDAEFNIVPPKTDVVAAPLPDNASPQEQIDHDLMIAMSLDDQERQTVAAPPEVVEEYDRQLALQLQEEENRAGSHEASNSQERPTNLSSPTESSGGKKKDKCEIL